MNTNQIAHIAGLVGEPARTGMLVALMDGRALTANELAAAGHISAATASRHLALLVEAGLLRVAKQGRHRYHRLASPEVARMLEGIMQLAAQTTPAPRRVTTGPRDAAMRLARTCYDHLAGGIAVAIAAHLEHEGAVVIEDDAAHVTDRASKVLARFGMPKDVPQCRPCLDWGERKMHLAGKLGTLLCSHCLQEGWLLKTKTRALHVTPAGAVKFRNWLGVERWNAVLDAGSSPA